MFFGDSVYTSLRAGDEREERGGDVCWTQLNPYLSQLNPMLSQLNPNSTPEYLSQLNPKLYTQLNPGLTSMTRLSSTLPLSTTLAPPLARRPMLAAFHYVESCI